MIQCKQLVSMVSNQSPVIICQCRTHSRTSHYVVPPFSHPFPLFFIQFLLNFIGHSLQTWCSYPCAFRHTRERRIELLRCKQVQKYYSGREFSYQECVTRKVTKQYWSVCYTYFSAGQLFYLN